MKTLSILTFSQLLVVLGLLLAPIFVTAQCPPPIKIEVYQVACDNATQSFIVDVRVSGGVGEPYNIGGTLFNTTTAETGNPFKIGPLADAQTFSVEITDATGLAASYISEQVTCLFCPSDFVANMPTDSIGTCEGTVTVQAETIEISDTTLLTYILHTSTNYPFQGKIVAANASGTFTMGGAVESNKQYYVSAVTGMKDADEDGIPDFNHECTKVWGNTPVWFSEVKINFINAICDYDGNGYQGRGVPYYFFHFEGSPGVTYNISGIKETTFTGSEFLLIDGMVSDEFFTINVENGACTDSYTSVCECAHLAIEWAAFTGASTPNGNFLKWSTATETATDYFLVECATDGKRFSPIAKIAAIGTSYTPKEYTYLDAAAKANICYYRIKQVDINGNTTSTKVLSLDRASLKANRQMEVLSISSQQINIATYAMHTTAAAKLVISDLNGQTLLLKNISIQVGENNTLVDTSLLPNGLYLASLIVGGNKTTAKFVK